MKVLQHNIQSFKTKKSYLEYFLNNRNYDFVILSEIYSDNSSRSNKLINVKIFQTFRSDAIIINYSTEMDLLIVKTTNLPVNYHLVSMYFPPSLDLETFIQEISLVIFFLRPMEKGMSWKHCLMSPI